MATGQTVIDRATSLLQIRESGKSFVDDDANGNADAFKAFQQLIAEWGEDNVMNIPQPTLVTDTLDIPAGTERALAYNLAVEIAPEFGAEPTMVVLGISKQTRVRLEADMTIDISVDMSDLAFTHRYNIREDR